MLSNIMLLLPRVLNSTLHRRQFSYSLNFVICSFILLEYELQHFKRLSSRTVSSLLYLLKLVHRFFMVLIQVDLVR